MVKLPKSPYEGEYKLGDRAYYCDKTGVKAVVRNLRKNWKGNWVIPEAWRPRHPNDFTPTPPPEDPVLEPVTAQVRPAGTGCYNTVRDGNGNLIGVAYHLSNWCKEPATSTQIAAYQPTISDQSFNLYPNDIYIGFSVGTITATDVSGAGLTYEIVDSDLFSDDFEDYFIIPDSSSGEFRLSKINNLSDETSVSFTVKVTSNSPGHLSATATITINVGNLDYSDFGTIKLWLDASDTATLTLAGSAVTTWADKSTNAYTFTQSTTANKPLYDANGLGTGYDGVVFDGSNDYLTCDQAASEWTMLHDGTTDYSLFVVFRKDSTGTNSERLMNTNLGGGTAQGVDFYITHNGSGTPNRGNYSMYNGSGEILTVVTDNNDVVINTPNILLVKFADTGTASDGNNDLFMYVQSSLKNSDERTTTFSSSDPDESLKIGTSSSGASSSVFFEGTIAEILILEAGLSSDDITTVIEYMQSKWGVS